MSNVSQLQEHDTSHGPRKLHVTILASEWSSRKGGLSTINRELAIQLAKFSCVKVTFFLPNCSDKDKKAAASHSVSILKAERQPGYHDELDWLSFPPDDLRIQVVVGHGVKLGHQAQVIRKSHKCKWVQIVHADPEELGIFKCYENPISTGEQKHHDEVELCQMADFVVSIGPKSTEAFCRYLSRYKKDVFEFTPGVLADFSSVQPETLVPVKRKLCRVLLFGRGDAEDFELKGFHIAARSVAVLSDTHLYFVGAPYGKHQEIAKYFVDLGIPANRLKVRGYVDSQESLKGLFCEVDLVVMPSRTEGFALTGLEALSAGLPVLVSKNSGFGEALDSVPHGSIFVIDSEDPRAWTTAIKGIWNRDRKSQLGEVKAVRCFYGERYSWSGQCNHLIEKMFKLVDGTSSKHEITSQTVPARELKWNKDFTEHRHTFQSLQHLKEVSSSPKENDPIQGSSKLQVTILASEWGSSTGELSTINRELAIQLAKFPYVEVTFFLPKCSDEDKKAAASHGVSILEAMRLPGYDELDWLSFPPKHLRIDVVVGHGVKLGHQAQFIHMSHKCKWVQIVHADPEELGIFKCYESLTLKGEQKHHDEVELCQMADFVVGIGPKLTEAFRSYPRWCKKDVFSFTPGIFADFSSIQPETVVPVIGKQFYVLVFGHADGKDLELKLIHIAAMSVASLSNTCLVFMGSHTRKHDVIAKHFLNFGIPANRLKVREYTDNREYLKRLFSEVDLVLMPSRTEGFGLIGLEALSAGLPVLVSKNSGFGEALDSVPCGSLFVIDSEDPSTWRAAIKSIWNRHRKSQLDEVNAVRCFYGEKYSWSKQCKHLIENMAKLVDGTSSEIEVTAQAVRARKRKLNEDFTGILCEPEITARRKGARKLKRKKDFTGTSFEPEITVQTVRARKLKLKVDLTEYRGIIQSLQRLKDVSSLPKTRASCLSNVIEYIRQVYQKREGVIFPVPWCEGFSFQIEDVFTRLRIVGKEKTRGIATTREVTNMTSIFTPHESCEQPLIVLIEGEPGMGKTTYSKKLVFDWASKQCREWDETFPRIDVLLFLRCRGIKSTIWDAIEDQILPDDIKPEEKEMFFQFLKGNPSKVLLVLDGWDEADAQTLEMCFKLIQRKQLPGCYIVLTSRHEAGKKVSPYTDTLLEIVGFTREDAKCFIRKYFRHAKHLAEGLVSKLHNDFDILFDEEEDENEDKDLTELLKNPLNALLLCVVFEDLKGVLPRNRTQLYLDIVLLILRRYESKNGLSNRGKDLLLLYKKELMILGETALDSLHKQELYFDDHKGDIKGSLLIKFGFLSIQADGSKRAPCDRYGFFHKSFQEFFAGYFLAFSIIDDVTTFHSILTDSRYMCELFHVFKFMSGIVAQRSVETAVSIVQSIASVVVNETHELVSYVRVAHYLIEVCKTCYLSTDLYCTFGESLELVDVAMRPSSLPFPNEVIGTFLKALTFNSTVRNLELLEWALSAEATNLLAQTLRVNTSLSSLNLGYNSIGDEGANSIAKGLRVNTSLSSLDMSSNYIDAEGAKSLAEALGVNTSLVSLNLSANSIGDKGANSLAEALRVNISLSSLDLSCNYIDDEGASPLAQALKENSSLSSLNLSSNSIFDKAANLLAEALRVNTSLSSLDLSSNNVDAEGAKSLAEALRKNTSLSSLDLSANSIGDKGANSLAEALRVNTSLSSLDLSSNFIDAEGATSLAHALRENTSLSSLGLSSNFIDAEGASLLAQALEENTSLSCLGLSSNSIGAEGANSFTQALKLNTSLASLDLSCNSIGDEGARSLSEALKVNTSLSSLDLSFNSIGNKGAHSLAGALRENTSLSLDLSLNFIGTEGEISQSTALGLNCGLSVLE